MRKIILLSLFAVALVTFFPNVSSAYFTTNQHAFSVNGSLGVFTIDFTFGHGSRNISIPIRASADGLRSSNALSYHIRNEDTERAQGTTSGIVLSNAQVKDGMYVIPKGKTATFTLLTFFTPSETEEGSLFQAHVTNLPFMFDGAQALALNPTELTPYTTKLIPLRAR